MLLLAACGLVALAGAAERTDAGPDDVRPYDFPAAPLVRAAVDFLIAPAHAEECGMIVDGDIRPNLEVLRDVGDLAAVVGAEETYASVHAPLLVAGIRGELSASVNEVHEGHGGPGDRVEFMVRVELDYEPQDIPVAGATCGVLNNQDRPLVGPAPDAEIIWEVGGAFAEHGELEIPAGGVTVSDASGRGAIAFQARQEAAGGEGEWRSTTATVEAYVNPSQVLGAQVGSVNPQLRLALPERVPIGERVVTISWHEETADSEPERVAIVDGEWAGTIAFATDVAYRGAAAGSRVTGPIEFTVAAGEVSGTWMASGGAHATMTREMSSGGVASTGTGRVTHRGEVLGNAQQPRVRATDAQLDMDVTLTMKEGSFTHTESRPIDVRDETARALPVDQMTCELVTGRWYETPYEHVETHGWFLATRVGELSDEQLDTYRERMAALMEQGHRLSEGIRESGTLDARHLEALLGQSEELRASIERGMICGDSRLDRFISPLVTMLTDILEQVLDDPGALDAAGLQRLVSAAFEVGALQPEAGADAEAADLRARVAERLRERADDAAAEGDCDSLSAIRRANGAGEGPVLHPGVEDAWQSACG